MESRAAYCRIVFYSGLNIENTGHSHTRAGMTAWASLFQFTIKSLQRPAIVREGAGRFSDGLKMGGGRIRPIPAIPLPNKPPIAACQAI